MNLKIKMVVVAVAVLSMTTLQVQAGVIDVTKVANDGCTFTADTSAVRWLDFDNIFYPPVAFSTITAALTGASFRLALSTESDLISRTSPVISGLRG